MPELIPPAADRYRAWWEARTEWGPGVHEDGFGLLPTDETGSRPGFSSWVARLEGDGHCTYRWIVEGHRVLGAVALRHPTHPLVQRAGHLGYGIRPTARGRGLAGWAVGVMIQEAHTLGMQQVIAVCGRTNSASIRTIEGQGGVLLRGTGPTTVVRYSLATIRSIDHPDG